MADPKDLQKAADAIHDVRGLAAVLRHKELDVPLRQAEEWARKEYDRVRERTGDTDASVIRNNPHQLKLLSWR
jgi:hypothetical protein